MGDGAAPIVMRTESGLPFVRTPDARFVGLPGFPYAPRYVMVGDGLRMACVDEGPRGGSNTKGTVLMLHGEPDWSYLYRKMIPIVAAAGYRVIVPDMIGMGRSDKPTSVHVHTVEAHTRWWIDLIEALELTAGDVTLFGQDWGGITGLRLVAARPEWFAGVFCSNAALALMPEPLMPTSAFNPGGERFRRDDYPVGSNPDINTFPGTSMLRCCCMLGGPL